jgi:hypothetical protein
MTSLSPYLQPDGPDTANVRFRVAKVARAAVPYFSNLSLFHYADEHCSPSSHGRYIDEIGTNKALVSRANQSIGMPSSEEYPKYLFVERRFPTARPLVFSTDVHSGGPARYCQSSYQFQPLPEKMYEVTIEVHGYGSCSVAVTELRQTSHSLIATPELTAKQLPRFCKPPSVLLN